MAFRVISIKTTKYNSYLFKVKIDWADKQLFTCMAPV